MNEKIRSVIVLCLSLTLGLAACVDRSVPQAIEKVKIPVKTVEVKKTLSDDTVDYVGVISTDQVVKQSFKVQGRLLGLNVNEGDIVNVGDELAILEPLDLDFALDAAEAAVISARAQLTKAEDALNFAKNTVEDTKILYDQGAVSKQDYDMSVLNLDLSTSDYNSALEQYRQAKVGRDQKKNMRSESILYAPFAGQIVSVMVEEGEMVSPGYPVLAISNDQKIVYTGVSQRDVQRIQAGMFVEFCADDLIIKGVVRSVKNIPDQDTRTYQVAINIEKSDVPVGAVGDVKIVLGQKEGIRIPIQSVLSSSVDYVFLVEDGKAMKRIIELGTVDGTDVFVEGLNPGEQLVIEGMKNLKNLTDVQVTLE